MPPGSYKPKLAYRKETIMATILTLDLPTLHRRFIGFDQFFDEIERTFNVQKQDNYPPHNIIRINDTQFMIELAVAGFSEDELEVSLRTNKLIVKGERTRNLDDERQYLHRGIASRDFERSFPLNENVEVKSVTVQNGIMSINLELLVPEEEKARKIAITFAK
jgi:molecular chaperone IbpA